MKHADVALVLLAPALLRLLIVLALPASSPSEVTPAWLAYHAALRDHLGEYLWTTTNRPPLTYLINAVLGRVFDPVTLHAGRIDLLLAGVADTVAGALIFLTARRAGAARRYALFAGLAFSFGVIPFELWRSGRHYDHHTLPLVALFAYAVVDLLIARRAASAALAGVAAALLVAQSPTNLYVAPAVVAAALLLGRGLHVARLRPGGASGLVIVLLALLPPLATGGAIVAKNLAEARLFATGNQAGSSLMIFVHDALRDPRRASDLVARAAVPDWFRWCYENRMVPAGSESDPAWDVLARSFGICFPSTAWGSDSWPFDVTVLEARLRASGAEDVAVLVGRDRSDMRDRQYLFTGYSPEQSLRWTGQYGQNALIVFRQMLLDHPTEASLAALRIAAQYGSRGPLVPSRTLAPPDENGMRTLSGPPPADGLLRGFALAFAALTAIGHWGLLPLVALHRLGRARGHSAVSRQTLLLLTVPVLLLGASFTLAAWDVDRYFMQSTPYAVVSAALILSGIRDARRQAPGA